MRHADRPPKPKPFDGQISNWLWADDWTPAGERNRQWCEQQVEESKHIAEQRTPDQKRAGLRYIWKQDGWVAFGSKPQKGKQA